LNLGDKIEYSQRKQHNLPDLINALLLELEKNGYDPIIEKYGKVLAATGERA